MRRPSAGGGWHAIGYTLRKGLAAGPLRLWRSLRSRNACKTCALGMGGQRGGMVNEAGRFPEFCKKTVQAVAADLQAAIPDAAIGAAPFDYLEGLGPRQLEHLGRLVTPLVAEPGADRYRPASWDEAIARIGAKLAATAPEDAFFYVSGRSSNEAGFLLQLFARAWGTNNVNNCSYYCHQASGVGLGSVLGSGTGTISLDDLERCDLVVLIGGNPASNHPRLMRSLLDLKRRGGRVVVINPLREVGLERFKVPSDPRSLLFGTAIADLYAQPRIGGDIALLTDLARRIIARGAHDPAWLTAHAEGWPALEAHLAAQDGAALAAAHGVPEDLVERIAAAYAGSQATVFAWTMGITHHLHGTGNVRAIANLALLRGMVGRPGAGLMPLRGHSNVQGMGTVGVTPQLKQALCERIEGRLGLRLPTAPGLDTMGAMERAAAGGVRCAWSLGGNLYGANPDAAFAGRALAGIDQVVYLNTTLNTGHVHGRGRETWILPVRARDEEAEATTQESMFSYVRLSDGGPARFPGPRGETVVIAAVAEQVLGSGHPLRWTELASAAAVRRLIAETVPGLEGLSSIDRTRVEFHIAGRRPDGPRFATADGRARLHAVPVPRPEPLAADQARVMTIRSEGQFNTVVYEDHDRYRGQDRRDIIMLSRTQRLRLGLAIDQRVTLSSAAGAMHGIRVREADLPDGDAAMYYPEANVLVPRAVDPESGTPAFKNVVVTIAA